MINAKNTIRALFVGTIILGWASSSGLKGGGAVVETGTNTLESSPQRRKAWDARLLRGEEISERRKSWDARLLGAGQIRKFQHPEAEHAELTEMLGVFCNPLANQLMLEFLTRIASKGSGRCSSKLQW